jgi:predicted transposase YdaD
MDMNVNKKHKKHKDSVFSALFMRQINDLSFTIDDRIVVLIEHQSTINENIPLRILMYIARVYEKITEKKNIYHRKLQKIPSPEFIVLYNGREEYPDHKELRLSASFKDTEKLKRRTGLNGGNERAQVELTVQVYNINQGRNPQMLKRSEHLNGYSLFIGKIKEYSGYLTLEESVKTAVRYCIEQNVLREFLEKLGSEVDNMLFYDFSVEEIAEIRGDERYEEGLERGMERGLEQGLEQGREEGLEQGKILIARNLLAKGSTPEFIQEITGLDPERITAL